MTPFGYRVVGFGAFAAAAAAGGESESIPAGAEAIFNSGDSTTHIEVAFDPNDSDKFVVVYTDGGNSSYGTAIVGTIDGTSISYGSAVVFNSSTTAYIEVAFDPNTAGKFVVAYKDDGNSFYGTAIVGTIDGTSITYGSAVVFNSANTQHLGVSFDPNTADTFVVAYKDYGNSGDGYAIVGTIDGTSTSYGSSVVFHSTSVYNISTSCDPNTADKFVVAYKDMTNSSYGTVCVGDISGTDITFGTPYAFNSGNSNELSLNFDPNTALKFAITYRNHSNSGKGTAIAATVSGTTPTFGSEYVWNGSEARYTKSAFDPNNAGKMVAICRDEGFSYKGTATVLTLSDTTFSSGDTVLFADSEVHEGAVAFDPNSSGKFIVAYTDAGNSNYGTSVVGQIATT